MERRFIKHPILDTALNKEIEFYFEGEKMIAEKGMMISTALAANGVCVTNHHPKDDLPQGIFCANGQCSQCLLLADNVPVKSCVTEILAGTRVERLSKLPKIEQLGERDKEYRPTEKLNCDVLIAGAGPAGLSAALYLSKFGLDVILADDKPEPGGKLTLQTHQFFGSIADCHAGSRGFDIAKKLTEEIKDEKNIKLMKGTTICAIFEDHSAGAFSVDNGYFLIKPKVLLNAAGAREKMLHFPGSYLPNIYGAGAFQTLVNRDKIKAADRILVVGGGNVGLIAAYHALQADIEVAAVIEALPEVSGYKVHRDKIKRLGTPLLTSHTVLGCRGKEKVEEVLISEVDSRFNPVEGTEKLLKVDAVLIGVGLTSIDQLYNKALEVGLPCFSAGDALEISEASAAFFGGKIAAARIADFLGCSQKVDPSWEDKMKILKSRPGKSVQLEYDEEMKGRFQPVLHCYQSIPCNPCSTVCPKKVIYIPEDRIMDIPQLTQNECIGCFRCVAFCPGLAITLVKKDEEGFKAYIPYELNTDLLKIGGTLKLTDYQGDVIGEGVLKSLFSKAPDKKRMICEVLTEESIAIRAAGIKLFDEELDFQVPVKEDWEELPEFICRCEHISKKEIEEMIDMGITDINLMKSLKRVSMGACGGKSCNENIEKIMRSKRINPQLIKRNTNRPFTMEIKLKDFRGMGDES